MVYRRFFGIVNYFICFFLKPLMFLFLCFAIKTAIKTNITIQANFPIIVPFFPPILLPITPAASQPPKKRNTINITAFGFNLIPYPVQLMLSKTDIKPDRFTFRTAFSSASTCKHTLPSFTSANNLHKYVFSFLQFR